MPSTTSVARSLLVTALRRLDAVEYGLPSHVVIVDVHRDDDLEPLRPEEERLLSPRAVASYREAFQMGRTAAHGALALLGCDAGPILRGAGGEPVWPAGVVGSITHSSGRALAAVARRDRCTTIGVDMEHLDRWFPELVDHVAFDGEREWLAGVSAEHGRQAVLELFSAKESLYKALFPFTRTYFGFDAVRLERAGTGFEARVVAAPDPVPTGPFWVSCEWDGPYVLTAVVLPA